MVENYNSFKFWENVINKNKTIRGHMFMEGRPTEKSVYFHTLIFGNKNGINNVWGYVPTTRCLLGYIQYSFLQEAFYKWIYGNERLVTKVPHLTVDKIIKEGETLKKIDRETALKMRHDYEFLRTIWNMPNQQVGQDLRKFCTEFNRKWMGNATEFLYVKVFKTPEELGEFVIYSSTVTSTEKELENKIGVTIDEWRDICKSAITNPSNGDRFKAILENLTEVF